VEFLVRAVEIASELHADAVSFWSGTASDGADALECRNRLESSLPGVLDAARRHGVRLALEPEPGMAVQTTADGLAAIEPFADPLLGLTVDLGHVHCLGEGDPAEILRAVGDKLFNVHLEDMRRGVHDHLMFGEGEMNFPPMFAALVEIGYTRGVYVELSRHSHDAVRTAESAYAFLRGMVPQ
jgi:sugar phosphate isomerase/epimerase